MKYLNGSVISFAFVLSLLTSSITLAQQTLPYGALKPFVSDGCSNFPEGPRSNPTLWAHCCHDHDLEYWVGGTSAERLEADKALRTCVAATGYKNTAQMMFTGVRMGGGPFHPTSYRWGFGWESGWKLMRGYASVTPEEQAAVQKLSR